MNEFFEVLAEDFWMQAAQDRPFLEEVFGRDCEGGGSCEFTSLERLPGSAVGDTSYVMMFLRQHYGGD